MNMEETINRINELYHLSKERALTEEEAAEQKVLRQIYINSIKANLQSELDSIKIKHEDGSLTPLQKKKTE